MSVEQKKKISENRVGKCLGNQYARGHKPNATSFKKGVIPWLKGKKHTDEVRKKMVESRKKMSEETRKNMLKNMSESHLGQIPWNKGLGGYLAGEKNGNWKGGITPVNNKIRGSLEYKLWSDGVWSRDGNCCQKCKESGMEKLVAHHIQNFAQHPELRFAIDNGRTFCKKCHNWFHRIYSKKNNTREQIIDFLKQ